MYYVGAGHCRAGPLYGRNPVRGPDSHPTEWNRTVLNRATVGSSRELPREEHEAELRGLRHEECRCIYGCSIETVRQLGMYTLTAHRPVLETVVVVVPHPCRTPGRGVQIAVPFKMALLPEHQQVSTAWASGPCGARNAVQCPRDRVVAFQATLTLIKHGRDCGAHLPRCAGGTGSAMPVPLPLLLIPANAAEALGRLGEIRIG